MKIKLLLVSAIAIVGMAVYTLTLSFTNTTPLLSQLEALASGEGGESGGDGSESGNTGGNEGENPESGQGYGKVKDERKEKYCPKYEQERIWTKAPDGTWGWTYIDNYVGMHWVPVIECEQGAGTCTPYIPC